MQAIRPTLPAILRARERLQGLPLCAPLVPLHACDGKVQVSLKLENLQPVGSFKIRPIGSAVLNLGDADLADGIFTCSSGNSGIAVAWMAARAGIAATVVVPGQATAPAKLRLLRDLGAAVIEEPVDNWWRSVETRSHPRVAGRYVDAVRDPEALAGNASIGLEILEQSPDLEAIFVPLGGGSLACGIALAVRSVRPGVRVIACELEGAQPFTQALRAGELVTTACDTGFVTGVGFRSLLPEIWPLARELIDGSLTVSLGEVSAAIRMLAQGNKVIAEGAGAIPVAAAIAGRHPYKRVCAVVSGGNLDADILQTILAGHIPR